VFVCEYCASRSRPPQDQDMLSDRRVFMYTHSKYTYICARVFVCEDCASRSRPPQDQDMRSDRRVSLYVYT